MKLLLLASLIVSAPTPLLLTLKNDGEDVHAEDGQEIFIALDRGNLDPCFGGLWDLDTLDYDPSMLTFVDHKVVPNPNCPKSKLQCYYDLDLLEFVVASDRIDTPLKILRSSAAGCGEPFSGSFAVHVLHSQSDVNMVSTSR